MGVSANAFPHTNKLRTRDTHIWGIRRRQLNRSAMEEPLPGGTAAMITVSSVPGKYAGQRRRLQLCVHINTLSGVLLGPNKGSAVQSRSLYSRARFILGSGHDARSHLLCSFHRKMGISMSRVVLPVCTYPLRPIYHTIMQSQYKPALSLICKNSSAQN